MMKQAHALPTLTQWLKLLGVAALYALSSWLIESHFVPNGEETIFFLPSGLALAAVLLGGKRYTGSVALGALLGNMLFGSPFLASALMASGSALAAFIGACLVQRHGRFDSTLSTLPDVVRLWFFGSFIASTVSAVIGTLALLLTGLVSNEAFASNLIQWWMGDTMGVVLVTPLILAWWPTPAQPYTRPSLKLCAEYVLILGLTVLAAGIVLLAWLHPLVPTELQFWVGTLARDYWLFLLIVWAAMRLGLRGTCLALLLVALLGQIGVHNGVGFFGASRDDLAQLSNYWLHTIILSVVGMTLGIHIAASRKMNNSLRESESTLTQEFNHIMTAVDQHSIVAVTDGLERITWVNDKLCDISGYSSDELIGETHTLFKSGMQPHSLFEALHQTLSTGNVWQGEICNRAKDGSLYWLQTTITPFIGDNGKPEKYVNISTDISDNKRLEALALAGNSAKSDFLANMSHEIRTPMNGVIGMVDILQQTKLTPAQKRMLDTVQKSSMALLTIVNDILDFSKIESGKLQIENISFHLRDLAESVAQLMVATTVTRAIDLYVYVSPALPAWVLSDPTRLRQVLLNLLGNAVKFTSGRNSHAARVMLFVEPCTLPQGGPGFQMRVSDSGIGMSAETQEKLFQPFTQADESTSRKFGGSGLGLSICKRLIELMGGGISLTSALGQGSEFTVVMPLQAATARIMPVFGPRLEGVHLLTVIQDPVLEGIVASYSQEAGALVTCLPDLAGVRRHLDAMPVNSAVNTVLLLGFEHLSPAQTLDLPGGVGVVRLIQQTGKNSAEEFTVRVCPLLHHELIRGVALASGRLALSVAPQFTPAGSLAPLVSRAIQVTKAHASLILLAEDNETNRDVIQAQLQMLGYASETAEDGAKALAMWQSNRFALLLTDCHMPNMDGFELTAAIRRAEPPGSRFPIVAVTANAMQGEAERCRERGMDDYLSKPLRMEDLAPLLEKWLPAPDETGQALASALAQDRPADVLATWDASTLTSMVGNDPVMHIKLLRKFVINAQQQVKEIVLAVDTGELAQAADIAHALKSSSRMVGALMLGELCEGMETAGESDDKVSCNTLVPYIKTTFAIAQEAITEHISQLEVPTT